MTSRLLRALLAALSLAMLAFVGACADDYGEACDLPESNRIEALCSPNNEGSDATCVFRNSAQCTSRTCARYQGIRDFCTEDCNPLDEVPNCPGNSICYALPGKPGEGFCVPQRIVEETAAELGAEAATEGGETAE